MKQDGSSCQKADGTQRLLIDTRWVRQLNFVEEEMTFFTKVWLEYVETLNILTYFICNHYLNY